MSDNSAPRRVDLRCTQGVCVTPYGYDCMAVARVHRNGAVAWWVELQSQEEFYDVPRTPRIIRKDKLPIPLPRGR